LHEEVAREDTKVEVVYQPLYWSHGLDVAEGIEVRPVMRAGILDWKDVNPSDLDATPSPEYLGPFMTNPESQPLQAGFRRWSNY